MERLPLKLLAKKRLVSKLQEHGIEDFSADLIIAVIIMEVKKSAFEIYEDEHFGILFKKLMEYGDKGIFEAIIRDKNLKSLNHCEADLQPHFFEKPLAKINKRREVKETENYADYNCPMCKNDKGKMTTIIISSADESKGTFFTCTKCGHKSKVKR